MVVLNWKGGLGNVTLSTTVGVWAPFQTSLASLLPLPIPALTVAQPDEYGIYFQVKKYDPITGELEFKKDSDGFKIPYGYSFYKTTNTASDPGITDDYLIAIGYPPGSLPGGTYSNALNLTTIRLGDGNDVFRLSGTGITQSLSAVVNKEASQGYIFQSNIFAGAGNDYVGALMPFQSVFKGGTNTAYFDAVFAPGSAGNPVILNDDLTLEEVQFGDSIELKGSRFDWDIEFKDGNLDGVVTLASILSETDYIATSNNNQISGFERIRFGDILFDLVLYRQQESSAVYGQPDYYLIGSEPQAPELNSDIVSGSQLWEAFRFNRTKLQGITGTATNPTDVFTGNANDTPFLVGSLQFASLNTEAGNDIVEISSADQSSVYLGTGNDQLKANGSVTRSNIDGGSENDNIIFNTVSNSTVKGGAGDDVIQVIASTNQTQFDGGAGSGDVLLLPGNFASYGFISSTYGGGTTFNDVFGNNFVGFESLKFSDINLAALQQLSLAQSPAVAAVNEGTTATYDILLSGSGLQSGQSVAFSLQLVGGTAQYLSDFVAINASSLLASTGIVLSNISIDATAGMIKAVATTSKAFIAGATIATLALPIKEDLLAESAEVFEITLRDFTQSQTVTTTINDVAPVTITLIGPTAAVTEGQPAAYTVALNGFGLAAGRSVTFTVDSGSGIASEGTDFLGLLESNLVPSTGVSLSAKSTDPITKAVTVTATNISGAVLALGSPLLTFQLPITVDSFVEGSETFSVTLASSTALVGTGLVTTTINDLVPTPTVGLSGVTTVAEGQAAAYAVSLLGGAFLAGQSLTLTLDTAGATATEGVDFAALLAGDLKPAAGISLSGISTDPISKAVTVTATNSSGSALAIGSQLLSFAVVTTADAIAEGPETYGVSLTSGTATVSAGAVTTSINNVGGLITTNTSGAQWGELNSAITIFSGIVGTEVAPTTVNTGSGNDLVKLDDAIAFATVDTGSGNDSIDVLIYRNGDELTRPYVQFGHGAYKAIISTGDGNDRINIQSAANTNYVRQTPQDIPSYNQPDYYDSIVDAGSGNDYVYGFLPYKSQFLGGAGIDSLFFYGRYSDWTYQTVDANSGGLDLTLSDNANDYTIWNASTSRSNTAIENRVQGFEFVQFNDINLDLNEKLLLSATAAAYTEGDTARYTIALAGNGLQPGQSVAFTLQLSNGSAQFSSDLATLALSSLQASAGIVLSNVTVDAKTGLIRAVASSTAEFSTGTIIATLSLPIQTDLLIETNETLGVTLSGFVTPQTVTTTITDVNTATIKLTGGASTVAEGTSANYAVSLDGIGLGAGRNITFSLDTASGTASEGLDFAALVAGALTASTGVTLSAISTDPITKAVTLTATNTTGADLAANTQLLSFAVATTADSNSEGNEAYGVSLTSSTATVSAGALSTTITDASSATIKLTGASTVEEGNTAGYAVWLDGVGLGAGRSVTLTLDASDGSATSGQDYVETLLTAKMTAAAGLSLGGISTDPNSKAVTVTVTNTSGTDLAASAQLLSFAMATKVDLSAEGNETYVMNLTSSSAKVSSGTVFTTITDYNGLLSSPTPSFPLVTLPLPSTGNILTLTVSSGSVPEDATNNLVYTFSRTGPTTAALTVNYTVGGTATLDTDYTGIAATPATKTVSFAANSAIATVTVDPKADTTIEPNETVALTLAAGTGYRSGTTAAVVGTILNDDISSLTTYTLGVGQSSLLLLGSGQINGIGNDLGNTITGNTNNNKLVGLLGADSLTGGGTADNDLFIYNSLNESLLGTGSSFDVITDFNRRDRIVRPPSQATTTRLSSSIGNISSLTSLQIAGLLSTSTFSANSVAAFTVSGRAGTFIAMNDGRTGFQAESDAIIFLQNYILNSTNFVDFA
jgi:hypothetical protein